MFRSFLAVLLLCTVQTLHAETKKPAAPDKASKTEKTAAAEKKASAADKKAEAKEKPAAKSEKEKPVKPAAGDVDPADQALLDHAGKELKKLSPSQTANLTELANSGTPEELQAIPGIGKTKADAIKKTRPLKSADQLILIDGIGEATFDGVVQWVKDGMPKDTPAAAKPSGKKPAAKTPDKKPETQPAEKPATKKTSPKAADKKAETKPANKKTTKQE